MTSLKGNDLYSNALGVILVRNIEKFQDGDTFFDIQNLQSCLSTS